jgi:phage virion morphogenesis protein
MIEITINDKALRDALDRLTKRVQDLSPAMHDIGQELMYRARRRFETSTGPDGQAWKPNAPATILAYLSRFRGSFRRDGSLSKRGAKRAASKKPLIGETQQLRRIHYTSGPDWVAVGSSRDYAAIHQFGGVVTTGGRRTYVPARPFLPVTADGEWLGTDDRSAVLAVLAEWLEAD